MNSENLKQFKLLIVDSLHQEGIDILERTPSVDFEIVPAALLVNKISDAHAIIARSTSRVTEELLSQAKKLKLVVRAGVGLDSIDVEACKARSIAVIAANEANAVSTAELTCALILSAIRQIPRASLHLQNGQWDRKSLMTHELKGKTVGIVGFGRVGSRVAERLKIFGIHLLVCDPYQTDLSGAERVDLETIATKSDIVSLHVPLTSETRMFISKEFLSKMKRGSILVNTARGEVVDETALIDALKSDHLSFYAADVFAEEPLPTDHPLRKISNTLLTPHIGAQTEEAQAAVSVFCVQTVVDFFNIWKERS